MSNATPKAFAMARLSTGIPGLDTILQGGLFQGGMYMLIGRPGTGKTVLANQLAFHHVANGGRVVYVTLLTESHDRMLGHLRSLTFFDPTPITNTLIYISGYETLAHGGLDQLRSLLRTLVRDQRATLLIIDGLVTVETIAPSPTDFKHFLQEIQIFNAAVGCTTLLLTTYPNDVNLLPEETMVDGVFRLHNALIGQRAMREFEIDKLRGSGYLRGRHSFQIATDGITLFPRTEVFHAHPSSEYRLSELRLPLAIPELDLMLHGGLPEGSTTMVLGPTGSGKTCLGLQFLHAGQVTQQAGLLFGFYETAAQLRRKAAQLGLPLAVNGEQGGIEIIWHPAVEDNIDRLAERLLQAVELRQVRRLFIDGIDGFRQMATHPARLPIFFTALVHELQARNVTTLYSLETHDGAIAPRSTPVSSVAALTENMIMLRYSELDTQTHRLISIVKLRYSDYDPSIREFKITNHGIDVAATAFL